MQIFFRTYIGQIIVRRLAKERMSSFRLLVIVGPSKDDLPTATKENAVLDGIRKCFNEFSNPIKELKYLWMATTF